MKTIATRAMVTLFMIDPPKYNPDPTTRKIKLQHFSCSIHKWSFEWYTQTHNLLKIRAYCSNYAYTPLCSRILFLFDFLTMQMEPFWNPPLHIREYIHSSDLKYFVRPYIIICIFYMLCVVATHLFHLDHNDTFYYINMSLIIIL